MRVAVCVGLLSIAASVGASLSGCATGSATDSLDGSGGPTVVPDAAGNDGLGTPVEGGRPPGDSGTHDTGSQAKDTGGPPPNDSGAPPMDSGNPPPVDSGSPPVDSGQDSGSPPPVDSGGGGDSSIMCPNPVSGTCGPGNVSGFTPTWKPPTGMHQGACAAGDISAIYADCLSAAADPLLCSIDQSNYPACYACLFSAPTAASWGPFVNQTNGLISINMGGCIDLVDPGHQACAQSAEAQYECELQSCEANCNVTDQASYNLYAMCLQTTDACGCRPEAIAGACVNSLPAMDSQCTTAASFQAFYNYYAPLFCGP
jgi:hypothetical protein